MNLYLGLPYKDRLGNDIYPDFRNMMRLEQVIENPDMGEWEKSLACLLLLYGNDIPQDTEAAYGELVWFYNRGEVPEKSKSRILKLYDFGEDAAYITGAFLDAYRLDLTDMHVHWWQFMSLFIALPEGTQMMQRMCDRNLDTSKMKGEQRRYYEERKKAVALKSVKRLQGGTLEERRIAKQKHLDELYAEAERVLKEKGDQK